MEDGLYVFPVWTLGPVRTSIALSKLPERLDCLDSFSRAITILAGENSERFRERREGKVPTGASRWNKSGVSAFPE